MRSLLFIPFTIPPYIPHTPRRPLQSAPPPSDAHPPTQSFHDDLLDGMYDHHTHSAVRIYSLHMRVAPSLAAEGCDVL
ncbi:hypothetical protein BD414DRAFT_480256 [Trametes punicea]|nr:hypothetical protein BD414DRAFT_480256 [Trametes punicea]